MANTPKLSAEYFPHYASQKRTVPILKAKFGSDGYAFWYQLLENLCQAKGHFIDCSADGEFEFLSVAKIGIPVEKSKLILRELLFRGKLDRELWETRRILWCQSLVDNLSVLYSKRKFAPEKPFPGRKSDFRGGNGKNVPEKTGIRGIRGSRGSKGEEESKRKKTPAPTASKAAEAYRETFHLNMNHVQREAVDQAVDGNLQLWKETIGWWALKGYKPTNIEGMLDVFRKGGPEGNRGQVPEPELEDCKKRIIRFVNGSYGCDCGHDCHWRYKSDCLEQKATEEVMAEKGLVK